MACCNCCSLYCASPALLRRLCFPHEISAEVPCTSSIERHACLVARLGSMPSFATPQTHHAKARHGHRAVAGSHLSTLTVASSMLSEMQTSAATRTMRLLCAPYTATSAHTSVSPYAVSRFPLHGRSACAHDQPRIRTPWQRQQQHSGPQLEDCAHACTTIELPSFQVGE